MSRRPRVPAPFQKILPSIIRGAGPRLFVVVAGCAALLLIGGSSYLISHSVPSPAPTTKQKVPLATDNGVPAQAQVLGTETPGGTTDSSPSPADSSGMGTVPPDAASGKHKHSIPDILPCTASCTAPTPAAPIQSPVDEVTQGVTAPLQGVLDLTRHLLGGL